MHSDFIGEELTLRIRSNKLFFGKGEVDALIKLDKIVARLDSAKEFSIDKDDIPLKGDHNLDNTASSILASMIMGVSAENIQKGIKTFSGLDHRFEDIGTFSGVQFIDDSKATNIDATRRALESVDRKVVLIAGGRDKGGDYLSLLPVVKDKVKSIVLIGEASDKINEAFSKEVNTSFSKDMKTAVKTAFSLAGEGDIVMLSPMCSSFDMYSSYKERGEVFQEEVRALGLEV